MSDPTMSKTVFLFALLVGCCLAIPGGWSDADVDDKEVLSAAKHANQQLSETLNSIYHHKLYRVLKAEQQVVAGMNYRMNIVIGITTCKKNEVDFENVENCDFQDNLNTYKKCTVVVYKNLKGEYSLVRSGCSLIAKQNI